MRKTGPGELSLEKGADRVASARLNRGSEVLIRVGGEDFVFEKDDRWDVALRTCAGEQVAFHDDRKLGDDRITAGDREYRLDPPTRKGAGELTVAGGARVAGLELRYPGHGHVLIVELHDEVPDLVVAFVATITWLRGAPDKGGGSLIPGENVHKAPPPPSGAAWTG
jgi:hypothetical protein